MLTGFDIRRPEAFIDWSCLFDLDSPDICLQRGDSWMFGPEAPTSEEEMLMILCFPAGTPSETQLTSITEQVTRVSQWPPEAFALFLSWLDSNSSAANENDS